MHILSIIINQFKKDAKYIYLKPRKMRLITQMIQKDPVKEQRKIFN